MGSFPNKCYEVTRRCSQECRRYRIPQGPNNNGHIMTSAGKIWFAAKEYAHCRISCSSINSQSKTAKPVTTSTRYRARDGRLHNRRRQTVFVTHFRRLCIPFSIIFSSISVNNWRLESSLGSSRLSWHCQWWLVSAATSCMYWSIATEAVADAGVTHSPSLYSTPSPNWGPAAGLPRFVSPGNRRLRVGVRGEYKPIAERTWKATQGSVWTEAASECFRVSRLMVIVNVWHEPSVNLCLHNRFFVSPRRL